MSVLLSALLPIALAALVGFGIGRSFRLDMPTLARLNIYALLPALVLQSWSEMTLALESAIAILSAFALTMALLYLLVIALGRLLHLSPEGRKSLIATTLLANVGNMGLPFVLFTLGEAGLERAVLYLVGTSLMAVTVFPMVLKGTGLRTSLRFTLGLPVFWAAVIGVGLRVGGQALPAAIAQAVTLLAGGAIPLALLSLGIQLAQTPFVFGRAELLGASLRLVVSPLLADGVGIGMGLQGLDLQVLILQAAMPVAVNSLIWVTELGGDRDRVSRTIVLSTLLSFFTLPMVVALSRR